MDAATASLVAAADGVEFSLLEAPPPELARRLAGGCAEMAAALLGAGDGTRSEMLSAALLWSRCSLYYNPDSEAGLLHEAQALWRQHQSQIGNVRLGRALAIFERLAASSSPDAREPARAVLNAVRESHEQKLLTAFSVDADGLQHLREKKGGSPVKLVKGVGESVYKAISPEKPSAGKELSVHAAVQLHGSNSAQIPMALRAQCPLTAWHAVHSPLTAWHAVHRSSCSKHVATRS
jgi:hypothetical protein